jgi:hemolysin III
VAMVDRVTGDETQSGPDPLGAARDAAGAAGERLGSARAEAGERFGAARDAASKQVAAARETAAIAAHAAAHKLSQKPRLRGVSHQWAFFVSLGAGAALILAASGTTAVIAMSIYAFSLSAMLGTSALYHRITWTPEVRQWMRRLDHTMIFVFIAGTYTPIAVLSLPRNSAIAVLIAVWTGALFGVGLQTAWSSAPRWLSAPCYIALGWVAVFVMPELLHNAGVAAFVLIVTGGVVYTVGGVVYALKRPNPVPGIFGFHEVFHLCTLVAAVCHYVAVWLAVFH